MLKSMIINNFTVFKGEHFLEFAIDHCSPITVISGVAASGKSSISRAITWCLGDTLPAYLANNLLNVQCREEMLPYQTADVYVSLDFEFENDTQKFTRMVSVRKEFNSINYFKECYYINNTQINRQEYISRVNNIFPLLKFGVYSLDEKIYQFDYSSKLQKKISKYISNNSVLEKILEAVEYISNSIFSNFYFRTGEYKISRAENMGFELLSYYDNQWAKVDPSMTDVIIFNLSVHFAFYSVLSKLIKNKQGLPFLVDELCGRCDEHQFGINKFIKMLGLNSAIILMHEKDYELINEKTLDKCGKKYIIHSSMYGTVSSLDII